MKLSMSTGGRVVQVVSDPAGQSTRPLRVLQMCTDFGTGGIARHVIDLQDWLQARGHRVSLAGTAEEWAGPDTDADFLDIPLRYVAGEGAVFWRGWAIWRAACGPCAAGWRAIRLI